MPSNLDRGRIAQRATELRGWLGITGIVLLAAVLLDIIAALSYATEGLSLFRSFIGLPGMIAFAACALASRAKPLPAGLIGAVVLVGNTLLIAHFDGVTVSPLIKGVSPAETVAGFELVFFAVLRARPWPATAVVTALVVSCLDGVIERPGHPGSGAGEQELIVAGVLGAVLLVAAIVGALYFKRSGTTKQAGVLGQLLSRQWPLIAALSLLLFADVSSGAENGPWIATILACSAAAATCAILGYHYPHRAPFGVSAAMLVSSVLPRPLELLNNHAQFLVFGVPSTQILAGLATVVFLVRYTKPSVAFGHITALSTVVALAVILNGTVAGPILALRQLREYAVPAVLALGVAVAFGLFFRARDSERTRSVATAVRDAQSAERMALARELHDVVAHHVSGIVVQAQAAKTVADANPQVAGEALGRIENAGTEALVAMRRLVGSMRGETPAGSSEISDQATMDLAADLRRVADSASTDAYPELALELPEGLPQEVARSALRLVQESLTNIGKHAREASTVRIDAEVTDGELHVRVHDNGSSRAEDPPAGSGGYGLIGMRERVELLGGRLRAGRSGGDTAETTGSDTAPGWLVEAWLPLEGAR